VLYEMPTGARAFGSDEVSDTLAFVIMKEPDWDALPAHTPAPIRKLLRRCLEKDRKKRLADIADARLEIDEALASPPALSAYGDVAHTFPSAADVPASSGKPITIRVGIKYFDDGKVTKRFRQLAEEVMERRADVFRKLAE